MQFTSQLFKTLSRRKINEGDQNHACNLEALSKHFFSSLIEYFSVCQGIIWNTPSRVWFISSRCLDIRWKAPSPVWFIIYFLMFGYQVKHSFSYLIYYFSVFGFQMKYSFSCLIYYLFSVWMKHHMPHVWHMTFQINEANDERKIKEKNYHRGTHFKDNIDIIF